MAALGVLFALALGLRTARTAGVNPNLFWNLCIVALFFALLGSRVLLIVVNWAVVRSHPAWLLDLAMVHHPLLAAAGALFAATAALVYGRKQQMNMRNTADALAAPLALGLAFEQVGAFLAGSGYGVEASVPWGVVYTNPLAALWSGAPLGVAVHPVQMYAAIGFLAIAIGLLVWMPHRRQRGDLAAMFLVATGAAVYFTELWRDPEGRGLVLRGALDGPQIGAIVLVIAGAIVLRRCDSAQIRRDVDAATSRESLRHQGIHEGQA
jgi:phosphatidylglycerol:prolipoprotein diacylglycerol transferase